MKEPASRRRLEAVERNCQSCEFFRGNDEVEIEIVGHCNRYPPSLVVDGDGDVCTAWPAVNGDEWCGEFRAKQ